jgi:hypothetical protein
LNNGNKKELITLRFKDFAHFAGLVAVAQRVETATCEFHII